MSKKDITAHLAEFIETTTIADIPDDVIKTAKQLITDFFGVATAGSAEQPSRIMQDLIRDQKSRKVSTIIGTSQQSDPTRASLANGIAGHMLDFDDVSQPMYGHPTVAVLPACLSLGESLDVSGRSLLESYIVGLEVAVKLAYAVNPAHYQHGWHSTCTLGSIGSAAAASKLLGLKNERLRSCLAIAASQAGGLQQNFGTMTKPFHAGRAAENGILAALLAEKGWTGDQRILESPLGFFNVFCGAGLYDGEKAINTLGKPFDIESPGIILKKFPSCAFSHPPIDAALIIAHDPRYHLAEVEKVEGHIHRLADQILIHKNPVTGLEAKFSLEACVALALTDGKVNSRSFTDQRVQGADLGEMMSRIRRKIVVYAGEDAEDFGPAVIRIFLKDGQVLEARVEKARGNPENPMDDNEIREKYVDCCSTILSESAIERSLSVLANLEDLGKTKSLMECYRLP